MDPNYKETEQEELLQQLRKTQRKLEERNKQLELINQVGSMLTSELELDKVVQNVTDIATQISKAKFGALFYKKYNEEGEEYTLYALSGANPEDFAHLPVIRHTPILEPTLRGEQIVRSDDITKDPRYGQNRPHHGMPKGHLPVRSYMALPVVTRSGNVIGGLFFGHPEPGVFSENEEELVKSIAAQAAAAIDNARLFEAKQQAEQRVRLVIESIPQMAWTSLPDGFCDFFNKRWHEYTGQTTEQARGQGWQEVIHPDDLSLTTDAWQRSLSDQEDFEVEHRIRSAADGNYRWHLSRGVPVKDGDREVVRWVGTNTDIEDRVQTQKKIQEREKLFREAEKVGNTGSYEADLATFRFSFSDNLYRLLGYEPQSFVPTLDFIDAVSHPEDAADARPIIRKAIQDKQPYEYVRRVYRPDGQMRYLNIKSKVTFDELGSPVKILGKVQDITEQKKAEQEVLKHLTLLKQAEEIARMGSWEYDIATGTLHWSKGMYRLFGLPEGSPVKPETYLDYVIEEDRPVAEKIVYHIRESHELLEETIRIKANRQLITMRVKAVLLRDKQGRGEKTLGVNLDISEIKQLEQENLELRLNQQKDLLLAILEAQEEERRRISESLHNGLGQLLFATKLNLDRVARQVPESAVKRTEELLTEAINETSRVSHELVPIVLKEFGLKEALHDLCRRYDQSSFHIHCQVEGFEERLESYLELALYRISQELVNNIVKHAQATEAHLQLFRKREQIVVQVRDNGKGFRYKKIERNGLGLRTIEDRVRLLNGNFAITSPKTGGTSITINIPVEG